MGLFGAHNVTKGTAGQGVFNDYLISIGTFSRVINTEYGIIGNWQTTPNIAGSKAGFRTEDDLTQRSRNISSTIMFAINSTTDILMFLGLHHSKGGGDGFLSGSDPLNGLDGFGLCIHEGRFKVAHNNNADSTVFDDFTPILPLDTIQHFIKLSSSDAGNVFNIDIDYGLYNLTIQEGGEIPARNRNLACTAVIETTAAVSAAKQLTLYKYEGFF